MQVLPRTIATLHWFQAGLRTGRFLPARYSDLLFGSTMATGVPRLITPRAQINEAAFDRWYAPDIWK